MTSDYYQIRICPNCGLRFPIVKAQGISERCPVCLAQTGVVAEGAIHRGPRSDRPSLGSKIPLGVVLDNVRSAWNVGSILRSADGFAFQHAYLCGITPSAANPRVRKTALGAEVSVTSSAHKDAVQLIGRLKKEGGAIWALENIRASQTINSAWQDRDPPASLILVVGNEVTGVDPGILQAADKIVHLPMRGWKQSFNVAVAFAIAAQIIRSQG